MSSNSSASDSFPTTQWTIVIQARDGADEEIRFAALSALCASYRRPVLHFFLRRAASPHDADDMTQDFFASLLSRNFLKKIDPKAGRFRTFLLACAVNHHRNHLRNQSALKRHAELVPVQDHDLPAGDASQHQIYAFDREWAAAVVKNASSSLREEFCQAGKERDFEVLRAFLPGAALSISCSDAARALGTGEPALRVAIHRIKSRFADLVKREIRRTVHDSADVQDEMRHLLLALA